MPRDMARSLYQWVNNPAFPQRANNIRLRHGGMLTFDEAAAEFGLQRIVPDIEGMPA